jgi:hypothetical protein
MATVVVHDKQLDRIADDLMDIKTKAYLFGVLKVVNYFLFALELAALGFAAFHGFKGEAELVLIALGVEIGILIVHAVGLFVEKSLHAVDDSHADRLHDELRDKARQLRASASEHDLKTPKYWPFRWWFGT